MPRGGKRAGSGRKPLVPTPALSPLFDLAAEVEALPIDVDGLRRRAVLALAMSGADDRVIAAAICSDLAAVAADVQRGRVLLECSIRAEIIAAATGKRGRRWSASAARLALKLLAPEPTGTRRRTVA